MPAKQLNRLRTIIANMQCHLSLAAHTRVNSKWRQMNFVPDVNRFYYILEGEGCLVIDGITYHPQPGQLFVMPAGVQQSYYAVNDNAFDKYWCHFTAKIGDLNVFEMLGLPYRIQVKDHERLSRLFRQLIAHYNSSDFSAVIMQNATLFEIISIFLEGAIEGNYEFLPTYEDGRMQKVHLVLKYIDQHLHDNITIQEMAELVHFHPNYFIRYFHEMVGTTPVQYIQQLKVEKAKYALTSADQPISEIAREMGMELYYFSRIFKKHTGLSPSEYRHMFLQTSS